METSARPWWQSGVIYQVYPRSFQDSDGDGIGDLKGIERRLDYLVALGVDTIWLSPIFPSPMADFGYDVADYCGVDPRFGTLADFDALLVATHARGLKLLLDFVPNHSSDQHPWFVESRAARASLKRDWYVWRDPAPGGGPPNNWRSYFGGSAWEWDEATGQYYLHLFLKEQPDLNWRNPALRAAMLDAMRFWLARGVDGFRIDVLWHLIKHADLPDNPPNPSWREGMQDILRLDQRHSEDQPEMADVVAEMRALADSFTDRVLIGEIYLPLDRLVTYYGEGGAGVHLPFNFHLLDTPWTAEAIGDLIQRYEALLPRGAWPNWVLGNHDKPRIATRIGPHQARVAAMLLLTLRGTPTLYYGDELGVTDQRIPLERVQDPQALREPGTAYNRDEVRTPMPWDAGPQGGFTTGEPWLPVNADWRTRNVAAEDVDDGSMLALHRALLKLRRERKAFSVGAVAVLHAEDGVLAYERALGGERVLVVLNLRGKRRSFALPDWITDPALLLSTTPHPPEGQASSPPGPATGRGWLLGPRFRGGGDIVLAPDEGVILATVR